MLENNRDRGKIKWTAMMLPEHIQLLRDWQKEDNYIPRPDLDDFDLQEIQQQLESALLKKCMTQVQTWQHGKLVGYIGTIEEIDVSRKIVVLEDPFEIERIPADQIVYVQHLD